MFSPRNFQKDRGVPGLSKKKFPHCNPGAVNPQDKQKAGKQPDQMSGCFCTVPWGKKPFQKLRFLRASFSKSKFKT
jgi:hypothetical protein